MGIVRNPESPTTKELEKWDAPKREGGMRPNGYEPFPKMVYQARKLENGKVVCCDVDPSTGDPYQGTSMIVRSAEELERAQRAGWVGSPTEAKTDFERRERAIADAAAETAHAAQRMSAKAQAELHEAGADTAAHVTDVTPKTKKAKKEKARAEAAQS